MHLFAITRCKKKFAHRFLSFHLSNYYVVKQRRPYRTSPLRHIWYWFLMGPCILSFYFQSREGRPTFFRVLLHLEIISCQAAAREELARGNRNWGCDKINLRHLLGGKFPLGRTFHQLSSMPRPWFPAFYHHFKFLSFFHRNSSEPFRIGVPIFRLIDF